MTTSTATKPILVSTMRSLLPLLLPLLLLAVQLQPVTARIGSHPKLATTAADDANAVANQYIVIMKDSGTGSLEETVEAFTEARYMKKRYDAVFNGYLLAGVPDVVLKDILESDSVKAVYEDSDIFLDPIETMPLPDNNDNNNNNNNNNIAQVNAEWGLDRIDSELGLDGVYNFQQTGAGVTVFIMDNGILSTHNEFTGRYLGCQDFTGEGCALPGTHGTHVAGTAVGTTFGVAKGATVFDVKILERAGRGRLSSVISGFDYVISQKRANPTAQYVINGSFGVGEVTPALNQAAAAAVAAGIAVVVAAGNSNVDACRFSPASEPTVITVGATTRFDVRSTFSNFGSCVDIFAPGSGIKSASNAGDSATITFQGTSMASPHIAGIAALYLEAGLDPMTQMVALGTKNVISNVAGSPNVFAFNNFAGAPTTPAPTPAPSPRPTTGCPAGQSAFALEMQVDNYGNEITWTLTNDCAGMILQSGGPYADQALISEDYCIDSDIQATFTIFDSAADGICCRYGEGFYSIYQDATLINSGGEYTSSEASTFGTCPPGSTPAPSSAAPTPTPFPTVACSSGETLFELDLLTDRFPDETSWSLKNDCDGSFVASGGAGEYAISTRYRESACIDLVGNSYTFTIEDTLGDGICCDFGTGSFTTLLDGTIQSTGGEFAFADTVASFGGACPSQVPSLAPTNNPTTSAPTTFASPTTPNPTIGGPEPCFLDSLLNLIFP